MITPGYTTTEFWATLLGDLVAVLVLFHVAIPNASQLVQAAAVIGAAIATAVYTHGRSRIKAMQVSATPATVTLTTSTTSASAPPVSATPLTIVTPPAPPLSAV